MNIAEMNPPTAPCKTCVCPYAKKRTCPDTSNTVRFGTLDQGDAFWLNGHLCIGDIGTEDVRVTVQVETGVGVPITPDTKVIPEPRAKVVFDG